VNKSRSDEQPPATTNTVAKQRRIGLEARCEASPVARSARNVLPYMSTHRSERWRLVPWIRPDAMLF
jgi:hypothetical protein